MGRVAQGAYHVVDLISLVQVAELGGGESHFLYYQCDGAFLYVGICDGQWHSLTVSIYSDDDKVASLAAFGNQRRLYVETINLLGILYFSDNLVHSVSLGFLVGLGYYLCFCIRLLSFIKFYLPFTSLIIFERDNSF